MRPYLAVLTLLTAIIGTSTSEGADVLPDTASGVTAISAVADVTTSVSMPASAAAGSTASGTVQAST